jgi:hypothetical protein
MSAFKTDHRFIQSLKIQIIHRSEKFCDRPETACQSLSGLILDDRITALIFKALQPAALEISMAAAEDQVIER